MFAGHQQDGHGQAREVEQFGRVGEADERVPIGGGGDGRHRCQELCPNGLACFRPASTSTTAGAKSAASCRHRAAPGGWCERPRALVARLPTCPCIRPKAPDRPAFPDDAWRMRSRSRSRRRDRPAPDARRRALLTRRMSLQWLSTVDCAGPSGAAAIAAQVERGGTHDAAGGDELRQPVAAPAPDAVQEEAEGTRLRGGHRQGKARVALEHELSVLPPQQARSALKVCAGASFGSASRPASKIALVPSQIWVTRGWGRLDRRAPADDGPATLTRRRRISAPHRGRRRGSLRRCCTQASDRSG